MTVANASIIEQEKAIAVLRADDPANLPPMISALYDGGVRLIEITMTVPNAVKQIRHAIDEGPDDMVVGVGSVLNAETALEAIGAGAEFVVSPVFKEEIVEACLQQNIVVIPGAFTPTEACNAADAGANFVKVFPAGSLGMGYLKSILAPMPDLKLIPTGGVTVENAGEWLNAGAAAVGIGSDLLDKEAIRTGNFDKIRELAKKLMQGIKDR
jgi:2-dehydro-3-deoxyphosphogluconate aldolase/(4S)-4-hydroxy-2-oxoglutarate aldolase